MTKASVKAMDTVNFFLTDDTAPEELQGNFNFHLLKLIHQINSSLSLGLGLNPNKFIVGGKINN